MCWNENISLNTFIFSLSVLIFIYYNNNYTQYKIEEFKNIYVYIFCISVITMQLIEYFLWKSINKKDKMLNYTWSIMGWLLLRIAQPISFLLFIPNKYNSLRNILIFIYLIILSITSIYKYKYNLFTFETTVKNGHLYWNWLSQNAKYDFLLNLSYFVFLLATFNIFPILLTLGLLVFAYLYFYKNDNVGSFWCWSVNLTFVYYLCKILFILPFDKNSFLC